MSLLDLNHANLTQTLLSRLFQSDIRTWLLITRSPIRVDGVLSLRHDGGFHEIPGTQ